MKSPTDSIALSEWRVWQVVTQANRHRVFVVQLNGPIQLDEGDVVVDRIEIICWADTKQVSVVGMDDELLSVEKITFMGYTASHVHCDTAACTNRHLIN